MKVTSTFNKANINSTAFRNRPKVEKNHKTTEIKTDSVEISSKAFDLQEKDEKLSATSGKDVLGITKGNEENSYIVHFSDSAAVSRAASRGYITINGTRVELTEGVKKQLTKVDKQAQADREKAYKQYIMQHELAVAKQQSETYEKAAQDTSRALDAASKMSRGKKISSADERALMEYSPQLYAMSKIMRMLAKQKEQIEDLLESKENPAEAEGVQGVEWADFEWKSYETQLEVSFEGDSPSTGAVAEAAIELS